MRSRKKRRDSKKRYQLPLTALEVVLGEARRFIDAFGFPAISEMEADDPNDNWVRLTWKTKRGFELDIVFTTQTLPKTGTDCRWECVVKEKTDIFVQGDFQSGATLPKRLVETLVFIGLRLAPKRT